MHKDIENIQYQNIFWLKMLADIPPLNPDWYNEFKRILDKSKSPIGIKPRSIWLEDRMYELIKCIDQCADKRISLNKEWLKDLEQLLKEINGEIKNA